jgi:type II secretory pathway component GspD/PulD (secretin)
VQGGVNSRVVESTRYKEIGTGFYVVPRLSGDRVVLDISPQKERLAGGTEQNIETQRVRTTVSGRLGEWIELGGLSQQQEDSETGWVYGTEKMSRDRRRVWVKVEELP